MVMATGSLCLQYSTGDLSHEEAEGAAASALHERLVAYVHALAPPHEARSGVWGEHSYARARAHAAAPAAHVRVLLAPRADPPLEPLDVERLDPPPPTPPRTHHDDETLSDHEEEERDDDEDEDEWEARVTALAPGAAHAALASRALDALRRLRLARLAGAARAEHVGAAARRLRLALAAAPLGGSARGAAWLHAALEAYMPRAVRRLYDEMTRELRRVAPRLASRLTGTHTECPRRSWPAGVGAAVGPERTPWLVWVCGTSARLDARWARRLGALLHTRTLHVQAPGAAPPDVWCAALAGATRTALNDVLAEAGDRPVVLCGAGAGASLCVSLAGGASGASGGVVGVVCVGGALWSAEGASGALGACRAPLLLVAGAASRSAARLASRRAERRLLEVHGADDALRLARAHRRTRPLTQHALDAAVAEEIVRWAIEMSESEGGGITPTQRSPPRAPRRRPAPSTMSALVPKDDDDDEYAHLSLNTSRGERSPGEAAVEGRVVSRGAGGTPLPLLPPARAPPALAAADIMRLPIVFADDEGVAAEAGDSALTVTSGAWRASPPYARVIVASRPARGGGGARPLLLRRAVRLVPRRAD